MKPLVSILIPAYNAEKTVVEAIQSALAQTWPRKEIIVINDGSTDRTAEVAKQFGSRITLISTENRGLCAALNEAYPRAQGDYIQELDADDLLAPGKIERQLAALKDGDGPRVLLSSPWAPFYFRTRHARFVQNSLCQDLSPAEWLLRKMGENLHMQNATWLVSRELAEAAGPWDVHLKYDQDGEYFSRVVLAAEQIRFVPGPAVYYRASGPGSISVIGNSNEKRESLLRSMKMHIQYLRSLEDSERVRKACLVYMQNWYGSFYAVRPDLAAELQNMATQLHGSLEVPRLRWKYAWMAPLLGFKTAGRIQSALPQLRSSFLRKFDKTLYTWEAARTTAGSSPDLP